MKTSRPFGAAAHAANAAPRPPRDPRTENRPVRVLPPADEDEMTAGHLIATPGPLDARPNEGGAYGSNRSNEDQGRDADAGSGSGSIVLDRDSSHSYGGDSFSGLGDDER